MNVFNFSYQQRIRIVFLFNWKLNVTPNEKTVHGELANETDNRTRIISYKHRAENRGGSRAAGTSKMERFVIIVRKPLTIITKRSILNVAAGLDPPLERILVQIKEWCMYSYSKANSIDVKHIWQIYITNELKTKLLCFFIIRTIVWIFIAVKNRYLNLSSVRKLAITSNESKRGEMKYTSFLF